jgi:hypothetical protein
MSCTNFLDVMQWRFLFHFLMGWDWESTWYCDYCLAYCTSLRWKIMVIVDQSVECKLAGETELLGENLHQCRLVYHKPHMTSPPRWEAGLSWSFVEVNRCLGAGGWIVPIYVSPPAYFCFLTSITLRPWRREQCILPKHRWRYNPNILTIQFQLWPLISTYERLKENNERERMRKEEKEWTLWDKKLIAILCSSA